MIMEIHRTVIWNFDLSINNCLNITTWFSCCRVSYHSYKSWNWYTCTKECILFNIKFHFLWKASIIFTFPFFLKRLCVKLKSYPWSDIHDFVLHKSKPTTKFLSAETIEVKSDNTMYWNVHYAFKSMYCNFTSIFKHQGQVLSILCHPPSRN